MIKCIYPIRSSFALQAAELRRDFKLYTYESFNMILDQSIFQRIVEKKKRLDSLRPLPTSLVNRLREQVIIEWTYNSNAIEGTSLSLRETELIIEHGLTIKGKPLKEHFEAINHKGAILFLEKLVEKGGFRIDQLLIRQIHQLILKEIDNDHAGRYREVEVKITGSGFVPPSPARLLMNLILMNRGYPPTVILKTDRQKYYRALDLAHRGELKLFVDFIGRSVERSLTWYLEAVIPEKKKKMVEMWQLLSELALKAPYSQEYLSLLARRGRIEAVKKGRNWYSNLQAVRHYIEASGRKR